MDTSVIQIVDGSKRDRDRGAVRIPRSGGEAIIREWATKLDTALLRCAERGWTYDRIAIDQGPVGDITIRVHDTEPTFDEDGISIGGIAVYEQGTNGREVVSRWLRDVPLRRDPVACPVTIVECVAAMMTRAMVVQDAEGYYSSRDLAWRDNLGFAIGSAGMLAAAATAAVRAEMAKIVGALDYDHRDLANRQTSIEAFEANHRAWKIAKAWA